MAIVFYKAILPLSYLYILRTYYFMFKLILVIITLQLDFSDVLAEPSAAIGFEWVWKLAFVVFSQTKSWFYKIFAALVAVPAALLWAVVFALVTVVYIWIVSPALRLLDLSLAIVKKVSYFYSMFDIEQFC